MASVATCSGLSGRLRGSAHQRRSPSHSAGAAVSFYTPRRPCRRPARVMAFKWGGDSDITTAATSKPNNDADSTDARLNILFPPNSIQSHFIDNDLSMSARDKTPAEEAMESMRREERIRDVQRSVTEAFEGAKGWWRDLPDKRSVLAGGVGLVVVAYLSNSILAAVDRVPMLPGLLEVVGFVFSCWFGARFVLFAEGRKELREQLQGLRRNVAEHMDGLAEATLDAHPNAGGGETGAAAAGRQMLGLMAARHDGAQQQRPRRRRQQPVEDDGSWVDGPDVGGTAGLDESYVKGLLEDLDNRDIAVGGSGGASGRSSPSVFALLMWNDGELLLRAPEPGAEEAAASGGGNSAGGSGAPSGAGGGGAGGEGLEVADLDPCLGWDTEACAASGHLKLCPPDKSKLESLEQAALRQAREALGFSRHVDQVLHEPTTHGQASFESVHLEGEYGRAAGTMEREVMEDLAAHNPDVMGPSVKSSRKPAVGEEAGTGP